MWIAKTLIRLGGCQGRSEHTMGAQPHCWFCHEAAQFSIVLHINIYRVGVGHSFMSTHKLHFYEKISKLSLNPHLFYFSEKLLLSHSMTKQTKWPVCPAKTQISLGICLVWSVFTVRSMGGSYMRTAKTLIRLGRCPSWSVSLLDAFCSFCHAETQLSFKDSLTIGFC